MPIRVLETFLYNGDEVALYHLEVVYPVVDHIFIVEARETFSGHPKEGLYHEKYRDLFAPYLDKVTFLVIDRYPDPPPGWDRAPLPPYVVPGSETAWFRDIYSHEYARVFIQQVYDPLPDPYVVVAGDADEIPNPRLLEELRRPENYAMFDEPMSLQMRHFRYSFDWVKTIDWYHPTVLNREGLAVHTLSGARMGVGKTRCLHHGGWHCSYFGSSSETQRKLASFAHRELDRPCLADTGALEALLRQGRDLGEDKEEDCIANMDYEDLPPNWEQWSKKMSIP